MAVVGSQWQSMTVNDSQWQLLAVNGSCWQSMAVNGSQWQSMAVNCSCWQSIAVVNCSCWQSMAVVGSCWQSIAVVGSQWRSLCIMVPITGVRATNSDPSCGNMCTEHAFTGVNSKSAWGALRLQSIMHRTGAQQNKTRECNGTHYVLYRSQE
jgi:hypothetical protein